MTSIERALCALVLSASFAPGCATGDDKLGAGGSGTTTSVSSSATGGGGGAGGGELPTEPDGPPKLTIVNGINDYDAIRLCFVPYPQGGDPAPFPPSGLPFAGSFVVDTQSGVVPAGTDVYLSIISGDLTKAAGKGCAELTSGAPPSGVVVAPLAVLPASAIEAQRSLLLVPHGCLGGPGHTDPNQQLACGQFYSADTPSVGLLAAGMSRVPAEGTISIQGAHAAAAMKAVDMRILPGDDGANPYQAAPSLTLGAIGPFPPFTKLSAFELGSLAQVQIQTYQPGQTVMTSAAELLPALERGGLAQADFHDGAGYTFVATGAVPGIPAGPFWHALTWTVVRSDP